MFGKSTKLILPNELSFMHPGTMHFVLTLEDCLAVGGHFHSLATVGATLRAMTLEHYFGPATVNSEHPTSGIGFLRLVCRYRHIFDYPPDHIEKCMLICQLIFKH